MQVIIHELLSKVRALDGDSMLAPATMARIVEAVLDAMRAETDHQQHIAEEQSLKNYQQFNQHRS